MKLSWAEKSGGSERHFIDDLRVYEVQYETLDLSYLEDWSNRLGVEPLLKKLQEEAETI